MEITVLGIARLPIKCGRAEVDLIVVLPLRVRCYRPKVAAEASVVTGSQLRIPAITSHLASCRITNGFKDRNRHTLGSYCRKARIFPCIAVPPTSYRAHTQSILEAHCRNCLQAIYPSNISLETCGLRLQCMSCQFLWLGIPQAAPSSPSAQAFPSKRRKRSRCPLG